jgi:hypothetical protein
MHSSPRIFNEPIEKKKSPPVREASLVTLEGYYSWQAEAYSTL